MQSDPVPVSVDSFVRAETDRYFERFVTAVGIGHLQHVRSPTKVTDQTVIRMNRDTLYSFGVFDLDAAPVTVTMPDAGSRFMSLQVIDQDHFTSGVYYGAGTVVVADPDVPTRYVVTLIRTLVDPEDAEDVLAVRALQDAVVVQQDEVGSFHIPNWDPVTHVAIRDTLKKVSTVIPQRLEMFGSRGQVDPVAQLIGTATGWGGNPPKDATYEGGAPDPTMDHVVHRLRVHDVPVDGFWSISVYNKDGFFEENDEGAYSINNLTAVPDDDGAITIWFGGPKGDALNHLPVTPGWNWVARLYRPRSEVLDGTWHFPRPQPVGQAFTFRATQAIE